MLIAACGSALWFDIRGYHAIARRMHACGVERTNDISSQFGALALSKQSRRR
jgi:hypothetical protein